MEVFMRKRTFIVPTLLFLFLTGCAQTATSPSASEQSTTPSTQSAAPSIAPLISTPSNDTSQTTVLFSALVPNNWIEIHYNLLPPTDANESDPLPSVSISNKEHLDAIYHALEGLSLKEISEMYQGFYLDLSVSTSDNQPLTLTLTSDTIIGINHKYYEVSSAYLTEVTNLLQSLGYQTE